MESSSGLADFLNAVKKRVEGEVRTDKTTRVLYSTDASLYRMMPIGVLIPRTVDDVQAAVEEAARYRIPVLPRGGGSSLAGQAVTDGLVIDFTRWLDQVLDVDRDRGKAVVQPGLILDQFNARLKDTGWMFGPDPASSSRAAMGGVLGNNSTGTHSILYGSAIDHIDAATVILHDGTVARFGPVEPDLWSQKASNSDLFDTESRLYRELDAIIREGADVIRDGTPRHFRNAGGYRLERFLPDGFQYGSAANGRTMGIRHPAPIRSKDAAPGQARNLAHLLCGAEGTLGIATDITVSLVRRPVRTALGIVHFRTRAEAMAAVPALLETKPTAVELFDRHGMDMCRNHPGFAPRLTFVEGDPDALLLTEYYGESDAELKSKLDELTSLSQSRNVGYAVVKIVEQSGIDNVWSLRKAGLGLILGIRGDHKPVPFIEDAAVPPEHLADYISEIVAFLDQTNTKVAMYAHASVGCVHVRPFINTKDLKDVRKMHEIGHASMQLVKKYGGSLSSEHADGLSRSSFNEEFYGPRLYNLYRRTKAAFDPHGILNPRKIVDAPPMTENLRVGPDFAVVTLPVMDGGGAASNLDFSSDLGFDRSVEMCSGMGYCRKLEGGTMCPSFMVTRDEKHSTRGRANALRAAMQGEFGSDGFTSQEMYDVMSLCISCKACKNECPSSVDMAKLKFEWQDHYWKANDMPRRDRIFARMPAMARRYSGKLAPLVNAAMKVGSLGGIIQRTLRIAPQRNLPGFARTTLPTWFEERRKSIQKDDGSSASPRPARGVVLFADTFNSYQESEIGMAAVELLERLGYEVTLSGNVCCGRTYISKGLVDESRRLAREVVERLFPLALEGRQIVGLEPSCILSLRDEYFGLLPNDPRVELVAEHALTLEEFIAEESDLGRIPANRWADHHRTALVHGHCHQKALVGMDASRRALELAGFSVEIVDSGCCGMAGSFGYEAEHYEWSVKMAERVLAPAVRAADMKTVVVAAGTSCRHQIADVTGRRAVHPAQALRSALR